MDNGIGIFKKIQTALKLPDKQLSLLELAKGKFTTDPARHTGQGIFFTSHLFDEICITSKDLSFSSEIEDGVIHSHSTINQFQGPNVEGTTVTMTIDAKTKRNIKEVFDKFAPPADDYAFNQTIVPVRLAQYSETKLISRSQAKRLVSRLETFSHVTLDFAGIDEIGHSFADEIFRVFARSHPEVKIDYVDPNPNVERMIRGAIAQK